MLFDLGISCIRFTLRNKPRTSAFRRQAHPLFLFIHSTSPRRFATMTASSTPKVIIQLHYNDLRTHDSPVLEHVHSKTQSGVTHFLPIFVFDERVFALSSVPGYEEPSSDSKINEPRPVTIRGLGDLPRDRSTRKTAPEPRTRLGSFWKTGRHRTKFTVESVFDLRSQYRDKGSDLVVACGCMESVVGGIVEALQKGDDGEKYEVTEVWMQKEVRSR